MTAPSRRAKSLVNALTFLDKELPKITKKARKTAVDKMSISTRPLATAKAIVRKALVDFLNVARFPFKCPDLSAALEARVTIVRRMPEVLRDGVPAYEEDLEDLVIAVILPTITQKEFEAKCEKLAAKKLPEWMLLYVANDYVTDSTRPIEAVPDQAIRRALGFQGLKGAEDSNAVIPELPRRLERSRAVS